MSLRDRVDEIASGRPDISFVSFADSILLKSNWWPGYVEAQQQYLYEPEVFTLRSRRGIRSRHSGSPAAVASAAGGVRDLT